MAFEVQGGKDISSLMKPFIAHIGLDITISIIFFFQPIGSYFSVYPWSQGYSFERGILRVGFLRKVLLQNLRKKL